MVAQDLSGASFHALRFGRAAARYESRARVQARMAETLLDLWGDRPSPSNILEFGCGTGLLTRALHARFPGAAILTTDASPEMLEVARDALSGMRPPVALATQDASGTVPAAEPLQRSAPPSLLASGALVQWFPDLAAHFRLAASLSAPGAYYLVSGFDSANFPELNELLKEPPFSYRSFPGHARESVEAAAAASGWTMTAFLGWKEHEILPTARAVLKLLQELGSVRNPREGGQMNRANLAHLLAEYERRFSEDGAAGENGGGVRLTWRPWVALLSRP
jgi:SAM-dependent methyltransferase